MYYPQYPREVTAVRPNDHIKLLSALHIAWSLLLLAGGIFAFVVLGLGGVAAEEEVEVFILFTAMVVIAILFLMGAVGVVGAFGLIQRRNWGRFMVMVVSALWLLKVPAGTALGIYSFYVLTREDIVDEFQAAQGA